MVIRTITMLLLSFWAQTVSAAVVDGLAARVGTKVLFWSDVLDAQSRPRIGEREEQRSISTVREQLIEDHLVAEEAARLNIAVPDEELSATIERVAADNGMDANGLREVIGKQGMSWEGYRDIVRQQMVRARLIQSEIQGSVVISDSDVNAAWRDYLRLNSAPEVRLFLQAAEDDNETLDLGWVVPLDTREEIRVGIQVAQTGENTSQIELDGKTWLLKILDTRIAEPANSAQLQEQLRQQLQEERLQAAFIRWLTVLKNKRFIERMAVPDHLIIPDSQIPALP